MKILIDNGHGNNTPGKRSPDGSFREYAYTREIAKKLVDKFVTNGYDAELVTPEEYDVPLSTRVYRINKICKILGAKNVILISIHNDAAGSGKNWMTAGGWSAYTTRGKTKSDILAEYLYDSAEKNLKVYSKIMEEGKKNDLYSKSQKYIRTDRSDGDRDKEADFYIIAKTLCPAILTENLFQDNKEDVKFLLSEEGKDAIVNLHYEGVVNYLNFD